ncbi:hypothetical protein Dimus_021483 [Dionaea muscipula]
MFGKVYQPWCFNAKEKENYMVWTNEMDRCLTKALVEEAGKGNKIDNKMKAAAFSAGLSGLRAELGLNLTIGHIKNRLKTWKKQYGILRGLLAQEGFKWDAGKKMVIASDSSWNDYLQGHPDARAFRSKVIENFDELCVIIGNGLEESTQSWDVVDIGHDSDNDNIDYTFPYEVEANDREIKNLQWTKEMDSYLGQVMVEQVRKGYEMGKGLEIQAYITAATFLNNKCRLDLTEEDVRNRLSTWKKQYRILKELLSNAEFQFDRKRKLIIADDTVWNDYIKIHPDSRIFRGKVVGDFDMLAVIFGNDHHACETYSRTYDEAVLCLGVDTDSLEPIDDASPITCGGHTSDQGKNTRWTKEMDHYLSMILVEQVKLGNKGYDHKLKPAAYFAAVSAVNQRFCLNLTKDHIKNRFRTWKKIYVIMKELLDQKEFKWDDRRKLVVAHNFAWKNYIKKNPDAKFLKGRAIENYSDLCVIMGHANPHGTTNLVSEESPAQVERGGGEGDVLNESEYDNEKVKCIMWTEGMDRCLCDILMEQVKLGNKVGKVFRPHAYAAAVAALNDKFDLDFTKENVKSRLKTWRKLYSLVKEALSHDGFEWDKDQKMVLADGNAWNKYIKAHPDAKHLRGRSIKIYEEMCIIVGHDRLLLNGCLPESGPPPDALGIADSADLYPTSAAKVVDDDETMTCGDEETSSDIDGVQQGSSSPRSKAKQACKKRSRSRSISEMMMLVEVMSSVATVLGRIADVLTGEEERKKACWLDENEMFQLVQTIPGFDDELVIEACEYLSSDENKTRMFLKLNDRLRRKWLLKRLRHHCG